MAVLEALVIATIILAGAWVGYHAWQDSLHETAESHDIIIEHHVFEKSFQIYKEDNVGLSMVTN